MRSQCKLLPTLGNIVGARRKILGGLVGGQCGLELNLRGLRRRMLGAGEFQIDIHSGAGLEQKIARIF